MLPIIFALAGKEISAEERKFFKEIEPLGFILFTRNYESKDQLKHLCADLRSTVSHSAVPILIDQEGGRVRRLQEKEFWQAPAAGFFANLANQHGVSKAKELVYLNYRIIGLELAELGITVNCAPVADLLYPETHEVIGDRSFGANHQQVIELASSAALGLYDSGIVPIMKHIPGHGRGQQDSHHDLPIIKEGLKELEASDFKIFKELHDIPWAMTAHIIYQALDQNYPITTSPAGIKYIRKKIGFKGILISDAIEMKALSGHLGDIAEKILKAGCDLALHCTGDLAEMKEIAAAIKAYSCQEQYELWSKQNILDIHPKALDDKQILIEKYHQILNNSLSLHV